MQPSYTAKELVQYSGRIVNNVRFTGIFHKLVVKNNNQIIYNSNGPFKIIQAFSMTGDPYNLAWRFIYKGPDDEDIWVNIDKKNEFIKCLYIEHRNHIPVIEYKFADYGSVDNSITIEIEQFN